ncbi:MAG: hypothetical protein [Cressdnaviricota sp.]|nr:MAG: hypothetical protein [Cressdnaviricota sp.]
MATFKQKRKGWMRTKRNKRTGTVTRRLVNLERTLRAGREQKVARVSGEQNISAVIGTSQLINLMPDIPQNVEEGGRIGQEIRLKRLIVKSWVQYAPTDANNRVPRNEANVMCRHFILKQKDQMSSAGLLLAGVFVNDELLESGEFNQGNEFRNIMSPVNRDIFTVRSDRKKRITNAVDIVADPNTDADANPGNFIQFNKTLTFGKMGKKLTFAKDAGTVQPVQFPYIMTAGYCNTNGTAAPFSAARIFYDITAYYTDA